MFIVRLIEKTVAKSGICRFQNFTFHRGARDLITNNNTLYQFLMYREPFLHVNIVSYLSIGCPFAMVLILKDLAFPQETVQ